jgi:hypothetical protein
MEVEEFLVNYLFVSSIVSNSHASPVAVNVSANINPVRPSGNYMNHLL